MCDVVQLPQVNFAENKLIKISEMIGELYHVPFADLAQIKITSAGKSLEPCEAISNLAVRISNMAVYLQNHIQQEAVKNMPEVKNEK